jgi:hypothetical protein
VAFKPIDVKWGQTWWPAEVLQVRGDKTLIHYTGFAASWDEWVAKDRIRGADGGPGTQDAPGPNPVVPRQVSPPVPAAPQEPPTSPDTAALEQMVRQNQERVRQQILHTQQQIRQWHPEVLQQQEPQGTGLPQKGTTAPWQFLAWGGLALACGIRARA